MTRDEEEKASPATCISGDGEENSAMTGRCFTHVLIDDGGIPSVLFSFHTLHILTGTLR